MTNRLTNLSVFFGSVALAGLIGCTSNIPQDPAETNSESENALGAPRTKDLGQAFENLVNDNNFRSAAANLAFAMGYGYVWGCQGSGDNRTGGWERNATSVSGPWREVNFSPVSPGSCEWPGLNARIAGRINPVGDIILGTPRVVPRGSPQLKRSMVCDRRGAAGDCGEDFTVTEGTTQTVSRTEEFSFAQELAVEFSWSAGVIFAETAGKFSAKLTFGQKFSNSTSSATLRQESVVYKCPLAGQKGKVYRGQLYSVPIRSSIDYRYPARVVVGVEYQGFPRQARNHWADHPGDRRASSMLFGGGTGSNFWTAMQQEYDAGYTHPITYTGSGDTGGAKSALSWNDLKGHGEDASLASQSMQFLRQYDGRLSGEAKGTVTGAIDEIWCSWNEINAQTGKPAAGGNPKVVKAKKASGARARSEEIGEESEDAAPEEVIQAIEQYTTEHPED